MAPRRIGELTVAGLALAVVVLSDPARWPGGERPWGAGKADGSRPPCCYANPQYSGICAVQPGEGETCSTILAYLNNPNSQGKTYCESTSIRGGWRQVTCDTPQVR